jgi:type I restriction enzyme S subunit
MDKIPIGKIYVHKYTSKSIEGLGSGTYIEKGDLVVAKITPSFENGKQAIVGIDADYIYATTEVIPLRGKAGLSDTAYLHFYLLHPEVRSDLAGKMEGSTGRQRLSKAVLGDRQIPLPPLPEQKTIVQVLSSVQRAIEAQEQIIQTTTELKKALMQKLFTEGLRGEPQKETEIGLVPESWGVVQLGKLIAKQPQNGIYKHKSDYGSGTQILRIDDFSNDGDIVTKAAKHVRLNSDEIKCYALESGDIVINRVNSLSHLGKTALIGAIRHQMVFESNMMRFSVDVAQVQKEYIFRFLVSPLTKKQIIGTAKRAVAQSSINQGDVKSIVAPKPSLEEQCQIVEVLDAADTRLEIAKKKSVVLHDIFYNLLHDLMGAKVHVHELVASIGGFPG